MNMPFYSSSRQTIWTSNPCHFFRLFRQQTCTLLPMIMTTCKRPLKINLFGVRTLVFFSYKRDFFSSNIYILIGYCNPLCIFPAHANFFFVVLPSNISNECHHIVTSKRDCEVKKHRFKHHNVLDGSGNTPDMMLRLLGESPRDSSPIYGQLATSDNLQKPCCSFIF